MSPLNWEAITWALPLGWIIFTIIIFCIIPLIDFQINSKYIVIKLLGVCIRKIPLSDIRRVSKQLKGKPGIGKTIMEKYLNEIRRFNRTKTSKIQSYFRP